MVMLLSSSSSSLIPRTLSSFSSSSSSSSSVAVVAFSSASTSRQLSISSCVRIRQLRCAVFCASKVRGMAELVEDKKESTSTEHPQSPAFLDARTGEDLLSAIWNAVKEESLPSNVAEGMEELYHNYRNAVLQSGVPKAEEIILYNMALVLDRVFVDVKDPFEFSPHHKAIREPFDYYKFGQQYILPLVDFRSSYVGNVSIFGEIDEQLKQGDNVVLMSNHQSEADPAVIALLLESKYPYIAENMIYIAGDRVITDPLCKPFSMGRNLLCVYSKKHMNDDPHLVEKKKKANTRSLKDMALLLRGGSKIIWIAPSGGRDRPDPITKEWYPAPFDASSADNMRRLVQHAGVPGHIYPLAILCYDIMPPPPQIEKDIGEKRIISFHGTGISVAPKVDFREVAGALEDPEEAKVAFTKALHDSVSQQYNVLTSAIHGNRGLEASTPSISLSQPWQ